MSRVGFLVDRLHVGESDREVVAEIRRHIKPGTPREVRKKLYREGLKRHADNRQMYRDVVRGRVG